MRGQSEKKPRHTRESIAVRAGRKVEPLEGRKIDRVKRGRKNLKTIQVVRSLSVYDGRDCLGRITVAADGKARAFDCRGKALGTFESIEAASAAFATESKSERRS
jgi:hypothetical protein